MVDPSQLPYNEYVKLHKDEKINDDIISVAWTPK